MTATESRAAAGPSPTAAAWRWPDLTFAGIGHYLTHQVRRRTVIRTIVTVGVIEPVFFLLVMGLGVGSFIDRDPAEALDGIRYLAYIGPGLLATTSMQAGTSEGLWPTASQILWEGGYRSALTTPLTTDELVTGHIAWIGARLCAAAAMFTVVLFAFGVPESPLVLLAPLAAGLVAMTFGALTTGFAASQKQDHFFPLILRLGVIPMFLFSGAFFPIDNLPAVVAWIARLTPAWHGVELCRGLALGTIGLGDLVHVAYLVALVLIGWQWARVTFRRALAA